MSSKRILKICLDANSTAVSNCRIEVNKKSSSNKRTPTQETPIIIAVNNPIRNRGPISCQAFAPFAFPICDIVVINKKLKMPIANEVVAETAA